MTEYMTEGEAIDGLRAHGSDLADRWPSHLAYPKGQWPIIAELQFAKETSNLTVRLICLDNGMWSYAISRASSTGVQNAIIAYWVAPVSVSSPGQLPYCPGCGALERQSCRHASGYKNVHVLRSELTTQFRTKLKMLLMTA